MEPARDLALSNKNAMSNMTYSPYHSSSETRLPSLVLPIQYVVLLLRHHDSRRAVKKVLVAGCNGGEIY